VITNFPIKFLTKNNRLNDLALALFAVGIIGVGLFYLSMSPSDNSSPELQAFWFIEGVPLWVKQVAFYSLIILIISFIIFLANSKGRIGEVTFDLNNTTITLVKKVVIIENKEIEEITVASKPAFFPRGETEMFIIFFRIKKSKIIKLKLLYSILIDELMETLKIIESNNVKVGLSYGDPYWAN
jgi:hypothetical protein